MLDEICYVRPSYCPSKAKLSSRVQRSETVKAAWDKSSNENLLGLHVRNYEGEIANHTNQNSCIEKYPQTSLIFKAFLEQDVSTLNPRFQGWLSSIPDGIKMGFSPLLFPFICWIRMKQTKIPLHFSSSSKSMQKLKESDRKHLLRFDRLCAIIRLINCVKLPFTQYHFLG